MKFNTKLCILILAILTILFFYDIFLFPNNAFLGRDNKDGFLYVYNYRHDSVQNYNQFPLWDIYKYGGMFPDVNTPHFYPFDFIFLFSFKDVFLNYFFVLHIFLAGLFTYFFARSLKLKEFPSLISAIIFMFSGRVISLVGGSISQMAAVALIPLIFWMFQLTLEKRKVVYSVLFGTVIGLQFLAGEPQYFFITCLGLGIYLLYNLFLLRKNLKSIGNLLLLFLGAFVIGVLLASVYFLPTLEFTQHLSRLGGGSVIEGTDFEYAASAGSLPLSQLATILIPFSFGNSWRGIYWGAPEAGELYFYLGIFPLILALVALLFSKNKHTTFFFILAAFSLLYAFGKNTPFFYLMYKVVPGVGLFRIPSKILALYSLSMAIIAGFGVSYLCNKFKIKQNIKQNIKQRKK